MSCPGGFNLATATATTRPPVPFASGEQTLHDLPGDVREAEVAPLEAVGQAGVVDPQEVEERGLEVVDVDGVGGDVHAEVVRRPVGQPGLDAAAGEPGGE